MKGAVKEAYRFEPSRLQFSEIAGSFEEVGEETKKCAPDWSVVEKMEFSILNIGNGSGVEGEHEETGEGKIKKFVLESQTRRFDPFRHAGTHIPVRDSIFEVMGEKNERNGEGGITDLDCNECASDGVRNAQHEEKYTV